MQEGRWTVNGGAEDLHMLSRQLRATGQVGLKRNITKAIRAATVPARVAVRRELTTVMPHGGGANQVLARMPIYSGVRTGALTAGVVMRARKRNSDLRRLNRGILRHPLYGNRGHWFNTQVPSGWWEKALDPFGVLVRIALAESMNATAREAGFV